MWMGQGVLGNQEQQIPFGDDNKKGNSNGKSRSLRDDNKRTRNRNRSRNGDCDCDGDCTEDVVRGGPCG